MTTHSFKSLLGRLLLLSAVVVSSLHHVRAEPEEECDWDTPAPEASPVAGNNTPPVPPAAVPFDDDDDCLEWDEPGQIYGGYGGHTGAGNNTVNPPAGSGPWGLRANIDGTNFREHFFAMAIRDPTHGHVRYVDMETLDANGLVSTTPQGITLRPDSTNVSPEGRMSFRMVSRAAYADQVSIFDVRHAPTGCGTWPAIWTLGENGNWPRHGEIDIFEGVNNDATNAVTLHTGPACSMPDSRDGQSGVRVSTRCDSTRTNEGCGTQVEVPNSFGEGFNQNGGGIYALQRTQDDIRVWFWPRNDPATPPEVLNGAQNVDTTGWGTPTAYFPGTSCNIRENFIAHNIIINLTFCGDWAGATYSHGGCPGSCTDFVANNPQAFSNAYFDIGSVRVYTR